MKNLLKISDDFFDEIQPDSITIVSIRDIKEYNNYLLNKYKNPYNKFNYQNITIKKNHVVLKLDESSGFIKILYENNVFWVGKTYFIYI
jgi:hypothetical protein